MKTVQMLPAFMLAIAICNEINDKDFREFPICGTFLNPVINNLNNTITIQARRLGGSVGSDEPPHRGH